MNIQKKDLFSDKIFIKLWAPSMVMAVGLALGDMADAIVLGQKMGATGLAVISLVFPVFMVINVFLYGFGIGGSVKFSKLMGEGKKEEAQASFNQIFFLNLIGSIVAALLGILCITPLLRLLGVGAEDGEIFLACKEYVLVTLAGMPVFFCSYLMNYYLTNDNKQTLATVGFTIGNVADLLMNIVFVLVFDMGVFGAAISTVLGQAIAVLIFLPAFLNRNRLLRFRPREILHIQVGPCLRCFCVGFSSSSAYVWQFIFVLIINNSLLHHAGENGVAVFEMVQSVALLVGYLYEYTAKAMQPVLSTYYGEHNSKGIQYISKKGYRFGSVAGIGFSILLCVFPAFVSRLFGMEGEVLIHMGSQAIRIYCIGGFVAGISILLQNSFQSCENEKPAFILSTLRSAVVLIPVALILVPFGLPALWLFYPITEYLSLFIFFLIARRIKKPEFDEKRIYSTTIENNMDDFSKLLQEVESFCEKWETSPRQQFLVSMSVEELCGIIMKRAFADGAQGYIQITLVALENQEFELHIRDNASMFDPLSQKIKKFKKEDTDKELDMEAMGVMVVKKKAKDFFYHQYQGFNTIIVRI